MIRLHLLSSIVLLAAGCQDADAKRTASPPVAPQSPPQPIFLAAPSSLPAIPAALARDRVSIAANPLVSRGKRAVGWSPARFADPAKINDGDQRTVWAAGKPTPERPAWVAIDVGAGPKRVLVNWSAGGSFNYEETDYGSPGSYRIETSPNSTDGADGTWKAAVSVPVVTTHGQAHSLDFAGLRWVKLVVTGAPSASPNGVQIDELEVHDVSAGESDSWFFLGDSITAFAFGRAPAGEFGFAASVHRRHPAFSPAVINGGTGGHKSEDGVRRIDELLARNPSARFWCLGYGTNDAAGDAHDTTRFRTNLETLVDRVKKAGRVPILATIPFASDGHHRNIQRFNEVIEDIRRAHLLARGPDLHAWFQAHPEELRDGIHPDDRGIGSINRLWAEAVDAFYSP